MENEQLDSLFDDDAFEELDESDNEDLTILELMEKITDLAEDSRLSDTFFAQALPYSMLLASKLDLTAEQAVLYSIFIEKSDDGAVSMTDLRRFTQCRRVRIAQLFDDIEAIEKKKYIKRVPCRGLGREENYGYTVPLESLTALGENRPYEPKKRDNLTFRNFTRELDSVVNGRYSLKTPYDIFFEDVVDLVDENPQLKICQELTKAREELDDDYDWMMVVVMCTCELFHGKNFGLSNLEKIFESSVANGINTEFDCKISSLQKLDWVGYGCSDGIVDTSCLRLTRKGLKTFLGENPVKVDDSSNNQKSHKDIVEKALFYDGDTKTQVSRLVDLLKEDSFNDICERLKESNMRKGFACLLYGAPGTGKTECCLQLARQTGRDIMQVNLADVRDKYVGESEKNVKAIFDSYREAYKSNALCPILLFNEADAIIGKRLKNVEHSVDQMNNSIQNIILQELETFEGILIATTNLEGNMDPAFERRFLYKIRFDKPSVEVRQKIWQSVIKDLADKDAEALAKEFDFSGGQIENIARKQIVDFILYGKSDDQYSKLREYCKQETLHTATRTHIGFN